MGHIELRTVARAVTKDNDELENETSRCKVEEHAM
jgi:hypothetical protein